MPSSRPDRRCRIPQGLQRFGNWIRSSRLGSRPSLMVRGVPKWYDAAKEVAMIERTQQQAEALEHAEVTPPRVVNPRTKETFVLLRVDEYQRLKEEEYDDSPWTSEERHALAWEAGRHAGWEDMDEYDDVAEEP